jgi:uncharacterized protein (DUF433 family)
LIDLIAFRIFVKMGYMNFIERITINSEICHGKPCIRNMRWPVEVILDLLSSGMSIPEILKEHQELEKEDIIACLNYAKLLISGNIITTAA